MNPLGVFGGTFDPIHYGHILPVLDVCKITGISEIRYIPNSSPGHRSQPDTDSVHRWNMTVLALQEYSELIADDRETKRAGTSYMVPTLRSIRREFGLRPLCLILGIDAFMKIQQWYWWANILTLSNIVVMGRPGHYFPENLPLWWSSALQHNTRALFERVAGCICHVEVQSIDISASALRKKLARCENVDHELPPAVLQYVKDNNLYT